MSTPPRIDELRKKFDENPRRYFAPLANEYRKAGDLPQAIALCREFLPKQPGHMSGHIVFGQALFEAGELAEARTVFENALALDPENLIALRHLGDIAKLSGDASAARRWYERVLDADPRNDDIAAQLADLGTPTPAYNRAVATPGFGAGAIAAPVPDARPGTPSSLTPPFSLGALDALPTPDAAMRAVDFDVVNQQIARYTPLDLDAIESSVDRDAVPGTPTESSASAQEVTPVLPSLASNRYEPLDLDAMEALSAAPLNDVAAEAEPALADSANEEHEADVQAAADSSAEGHASLLTTDPGDAGDAPAAEVEARDEGAIAEDLIPHDEPSPLVADAAEGDSAPVAPPVDAWDASDEGNPVETDDRAVTPLAMSASDSEFGEEFEEGILAPEWPDTADLIAKFQTPRSVTPAHTSVTPDMVAAFGREPGEALPDPAFDTRPEASDDLPPAVDHDSAPSDEAFAAALGAQVDAEIDAESGGDFADIAVSAETEAAPVDAPASDPEPVWSSVTEPLPDASPEPVSEAQAEYGSEHTAAADEVSFADVLEGDEDLPRLSSSPTPTFSPSVTAPVMQAPDASPAFVTETMGELLVSQGFTSRAIEVYEELVRRRPYDPVLTSRLAELRERLELEAAAETASVTPRYVTPFEATAVQVTPAHVTPIHSTPVSSSTVEFTTASATPHRNTPLHNTPLHNTPFRSTPLHATPVRSTPLHSTPLHSTPLHATPLSTAAQFDDEERVTARELFARLAARRVPRRTPPQPVPAVSTADPSEGLATLFGENTATRDDSAARALADAFAPISPQDMASGAALDFDFGAASSTPTPASAPAVGAPVSFASGGVRAPESTPTGNAGFSFDRFFPDPASRQPSTAAPTATGRDSGVPDGAPSAGTPAPADDLAQFSAWLKGLGNS